MLKLFLISALLFLSGCDNSAKEFQHSSLQFGTLIDITLYDVTPEQAATAFAQLDEDFAMMHTAWSPWVPGSLRRANQLLKTGATFSAGPSILGLINQSKVISEKTDNLFNPAIGELINLWQMHKSSEPGIHPPDKKRIAELVKSQPQLSDIEIDGVRISTKNKAVSLSFGAFAKGYAIDLEIAMLKNLGIKNAIINTGGDLKAIGSHGDRPWFIAIQHPRKDTWLAKIETHGEESIFTSGDYERFYMYEGKRYHHIIDPRSGYPAQGTQSVTVIHTDSALADAAATALFVAGPEQWFETAKKLQLKEVMLIDSEGIIHITPDMKKRLSFNSKIQTTIMTTAPL